MAEDRRVVAESSRLLLALADSNSAAGLRLIDACCIFLIQYSHARLMPCIPRLHASTQLEGHARVGRMLWMRSGGRSRTLDFPFVFLVFFGHLHGVFGEGVDAWCEQWSEPGGGAHVHMRPSHPIGGLGWLECPRKRRGDRKAAGSAVGWKRQ